MKQGVFPGNEAAAVDWHDDRKYVFVPVIESPQILRQSLSRKPDANVPAPIDNPIVVGKPGDAEMRQEILGELVFSWGPRGGVLANGQNRPVPNV